MTCALLGQWLSWSLDGIDRYGSAEVPTMSSDLDGVQILGIIFLERAQSSFRSLLVPSGLRNDSA